MNQEEVFWITTAIKLLLLFWHQKRTNVLDLVCLIYARSVWYLLKRKWVVKPEAWGEINKKVSSEAWSVRRNKIKCLFPLLTTHYSLRAALHKSTQLITIKKIPRIYSHQPSHAAKTDRIKASLCSPTLDCALFPVGNINGGDERGNTAHYTIIHGWSAFSASWRVIAGGGSLNG